MKAKFIGVPGQPEISRITMYGQLFFKDEWTDVPKGLAEKKLANHPHFESKLDKSEIAEDAKIKGEFDKMVAAEANRIEETQEQDEQAQSDQAEANAKADEVVDASKDDVISSALEYQLAESAAPAVAAPLTETPHSAADYQAREEAGQVPAEIQPEPEAEETKRGPGRPRKN